MGTHLVLLSVEGSARFHLEAGDQDEAQELAEELLDSGEWMCEKDDLDYQIVAVEKVKEDRNA